MSKFDFDTDHLADYLEQHIDGFSGPLNSSKFAGGQSNPTFRLDTANKSYVLRRKPPGKLLRGAHAVDREFRVLSALQNTDVPVARTYHLCEDESIIGSMFYVMEFVSGRVLWDPTLPDMEPAQRTAIYREMNRVLAALHSVNVEDVGLQSFGKPGDYFARQINTWTKQYQASEISRIESMVQLIEWLPDNLPAEDGQATIVHGDYRLDNLMFDAHEESIIAVLDWELSTIGHPYADLAYQCMQYYMPRGAGLPGLAGLDYARLGIPSESEYIAMYCQRAGIEEIPNWNFYLSFSLFRLAAICQGVKKRSVDGNASSEKANSYGAIVEPLANIALELARENASSSA
ncbi:MAG: phosphotransferase [Gammaproteobacteria bacterium]|nr:phosphotransferase [Gammaproteobacteria bacterium]